MKVKVNDYRRGLLAFSLILALVFFSCDKNPHKEGACEIKTINHVGNVFYTCTNGDDMYCDGPEEASEPEETAFAFHEGAQCSELGYTYQNNDGGAWTAEEGGSSIPGSGGAFADDITSPPGVNCNNYEGPEGDTQWETLCRSAWQYTCAGMPDAVEATCHNFEGLQEEFPDIPDCPYCN